MMFLLELGVPTNKSLIRNRKHQDMELVIPMVSEFYREGDTLL